MTDDISRLVEQERKRKQRLVDETRKVGLGPRMPGDPEPKPNAGENLIDSLKRRSRNLLR